MSDKQVILHLSLIPGIGPASVSMIAQHVQKNQWAELYGYSSADFIRMGISAKKAGDIVAGLHDTKVLERELLMMKQHHALYVTLVCEDYPELLRHIHLPPAVLWFQGTYCLHDPMLAVVGSRMSHQYGQMAVQQLLPTILDAGYSIVSGGAVGADTYAHHVAVEHKGKTVVVLGSGLAHWYPQSNIALFNQIIASGGMIVSSVPMNTKPTRHNFPARNRIIAGMAQALLVVQAARKSGARITAEFALQQGKTIFAVPGSIHDPLSAGCHDLLQMGASVAAHAEDIQKELGLHVVGAKQSVDRPKESEHPVLQHLYTPMAIDTLQTLVSMPGHELQDVLFDLSLEGKVEQDALGLWRRC